MSTELKIAAGVVVTAIVAFLAFGVFGVHTLFIDDEVNEGVPVFTSGAASEIDSDQIDEAMTAEMNEAMEGESTQSEVEADDDMPDMGSDDPVRLVEGSFIDRSHPGSGTAVVLSNADESQRFLRFEEDFDTDNGPDLEVYLVANADADSDAGVFDDDFISLGDLKGNIGSQNYEIPADIDLSVYDTAVVWCVRFGVAFTAANLS